MFGYLYEWLRDVSYYLILVTAVTYVLPTNSYRKYIRFFTGLVFIMMLLTPVLYLFGDNSIQDLVDFETWEKHQIEEFQVGNIENDIGENKMTRIQIEVEDIAIEP